MASLDQHPIGLEWVQTLLSQEPRWTIDIDLEMIKREVEESQLSKCHQITFLAEGAFNKIFIVRTDDDDLIMRVSLPVDPKWKTASEVATMEWVHYNTSIPVPRVLAYKNHRDNPVGFEWILMSKIPGQTLFSAWTSIEPEAKQKVVHDLAVFTSNLFENQWRGIGNIYPKEGECLLSDKGQLSELGRMVSMEFFWVDRLQQNVPRGPFRSSRDWITARLSLYEAESRSTLANSEDAADLEGAAKTLKIILKLQSLLINLFPQEGAEPEVSTLHHRDISKRNIMVDDKDIVTGLLDWECVSAVPLWKACCYPSFLESPVRELEPDRSRYRCDEKGIPNELYWEHMNDYEITFLRRYFMDEMRRLQPKWIRVFEASHMQRAFDFAVNNCDNGFLTWEINQWLDSIGTGTEPDSELFDRIQRY